MKRWVLMMGLLMACLAMAGEGDAMLGTWVTSGGLSKVEITKCGSRYCGTIQWMKTPKNDANNADATLRGRPLVGAQILTGFGADGMGGKIYAPERGKLMDAKLVVVGGDSLEVRVSAGMIKKTVAWTRVR